MTVQTAGEEAIPIPPFIAAATTVIKIMFSSSQYQYYFRQGFLRGYQDGYDRRYRYGSNNNGAFNILGSILNGILNIQNY